MQTGLLIIKAKHVPPGIMPTRQPMPLGMPTSRGTMSAAPWNANVSKEGGLATTSERTTDIDS